MIKYYLTIKPQIPPEHRHKIEDALEELGYRVAGGGQSVNILDEYDLSFSDIAFNKEE